MSAKFEVYQDKKDKFRFRLKAANGDIIATGKGYPTKTAAKEGIASIVENAPIAEIEDTTDRYYMTATVTQKVYSAPIKGRRKLISSEERVIKNFPLLSKMKGNIGALLYCLNTEDEGVSSLGEQDTELKTEQAVNEDGMTQFIKFLIIKDFLLNDEKNAVH